MVNLSYRVLFNRTLFYRGTLLAILLLISGVSIAPAQQFNPIRPEQANTDQTIQTIQTITVIEKDAWKYVTISSHIGAAQKAQLDAINVLSTLPQSYQQAINKADYLDDQIKIAMQLASEQLVKTKVIMLSSRQNSFELESYQKLIEFARLSMESVTENRFNQRDYRLLCKHFEIALRDQISAMEELYNLLDEKENIRLEPILLSARQYRIQVLNRIFGSVLITPPQQFVGTSAEQLGKQLED